MIKNKGFTLVELMVTITIMVMLTGIILVAISPSKSKGRDSKKVSDVQNVVLALETYFSKYRSYPTTLADANFTAFISKVPTDATFKYVPMYKTTSSSISACGGSGQPGANFYHMGIDLENTVSVDKAGKKTDTDFLIGGSPKYLRCGLNAVIDGTLPKVYDQVPSF